MHERVKVEGNSIRMLKSPKTSSEQLKGGISLEAIVLGRGYPESNC